MIVDIKGYQIEIDEEDYDKISKCKWQPVVGIDKNGRPHEHVYFNSSIKLEGERRFLHRVVLGNFDDKVCVDHKDRNTLNNKKENLRVATHAQNNFNAISKNKAGLKGITWQPSMKKWQSQIKYGGRTIYLGCFDTSIEAHERYRRAAVEIAGEFARWT